MITVLEAEHLILRAISEAGTSSLPIDLIHNHVLKEDIYSDRDLPPFNRIAMDGIAISFQSYEKGHSSWKIEGTQKAGSPQLTLSSTSNCLEAMTGAPLPKGCDTIIRYEDLVIENETATLIENCEITALQNVHHQGSDRQKGNLLLSKNTILDAPKLSIIASVGKNQIKVAKPFSIAIISTGDELVSVESNPLPHQIRRSNNYGISQLIKEHTQAQIQSYHIPDKPEQLMEKISQILQDHDILIMSGGVSMGKFDFVPQVLNDLKVEKIFHKIKQKPGKPMWFGISSDQKPIFALPGNPVSALVCCRRYVLPALQKMQSKATSKIELLQVKLTENITLKNQFTNFLPVNISNVEHGVIQVKNTPMNGSGDFVGLGQSDGFIELSSEKTNYEANELVPFWTWRKEI